jgi:hypothetical protein
MRYILILLLFFSCQSEKRLADKALKSFNKTNAKYNDKSDLDTAGKHWCYTMYPIEAKVLTRTITKQGKTVKITNTDTVTVDCDTIRSVIRVPCPPSTATIVHDTTMIVDSVIMEDSRKIDVLNARIKAADKSIADANNDVRKIGLWFVVLLLLNVGYVIVRYLKR